jgi:hypothetical protein
MDDLYSVGSSVPDRPPQPTGPPKTAVPAASTAAPEVTAANPAPRLPGKVEPGALARSGAGSGSIASSRAVVQEKVPAAADPNEATRQTVELMCKYIREGAADDLVKWWAECGVTRYGQGNRDPQAMCWAMYWLVKHAILFARDEPRLFSVGEPDGLDMLIAPALLVRMSQPKEDCDGFTMLLCALLSYLGVRSVIVTVAADPSDPTRWSHVFPMAVMPSGSVVALDASHGHMPGWMVPREHIFRWQAWDLNGAPIDVPIPSKHRAGLHGYVPRGRRMPRRGMGQCYDDDGDSIPCGTDGSTPTPVSTPIPGGTMTGALPCYDVNGNVTSCGPMPGGSTGLPVGGGGDVLTGNAGGTPAPTGTNWASVISSIVGAGARDAQLALSPAGSYINSAGQVVTPFAGLSNILPYLLIAGVGLLILSVAGHEG